VDPFFPENPEIPLVLAAAGTAQYKKTNVRSAIQARPMKRMVLEALEVLK
jgi:hypothetical protein